LILRDYSWGKNCDRTQHPRGITVKLEYQFTFKEYLEASIISTKLETFSEVEFWTRAVLIVGRQIVYIIAGPNPFWGYFIIGFGICYISIVKFLFGARSCRSIKVYFGFGFSGRLNWRPKGRFQCSLFCYSGQLYNLFIGQLNFLESFNSVGG
jgi:hypothetical protein